MTITVNTFRHATTQMDDIQIAGIISALDATMPIIEADQSDDAPGKTDTLNLVAEENGREAVDISTKELPAEDLRGLPSFSEDKE